MKNEMKKNVAILALYESMAQQDICLSDILEPVAPKVNMIKTEADKTASALMGIEAVVARSLKGGYLKLN